MSYQLAMTNDITQLPGSSGAESSEQPSLAGLIDALISYVVDPAQWETFVREIDGYDQDSWEPGQFLTTLSRAEALSWQMKHERTDLAHPRFAYVLLDDGDRATAVCRPRWCSARVTSPRPR